MKQRGRRNADDVLLMALACGATWEAAAHSAGVSEATVQRRLKDPAFCKRLDDIRADMLTRTASMMTAASLESVKNLNVLQKEPYPPAVRLGASRAMIELGAKVREAADLTARVKALEERLEGDVK